MRRTGGVVLRSSPYWLVMLLLAATVVVVLPTRASAQTQRSSVEYEVDLETPGVVVTTTFHPERLATVLWLAVPKAATDLEVTAEGGAIRIAPDPDAIEDDFWAYYSLDTTGVAAGPAQLTYRIPSDPPRTVGFTRVNPAHIEFYVLPDPAFGSQDVTITIPDTFRAELGPQYDLFTPGLQNGTRTYRADSVSPANFQVLFIARNEQGLVREPVNVGTHDVQIAAWADDVEWQQFARESVGAGVPALAQLIGSDWPEDDLVVLESTAPYERGAGGWFSSSESEIEVGDFLDETTMLHELAHAWFNGVTLEETWMVEGFAEFYSALAVAKLSGETTVPETPPADLGQLASWDFVILSDPAVGDYYNASWYVMHELHRELGTEGMAEVVQVMLDGVPSYATEESATISPANDWRRFLDVLEETGESKTAKQLFNEFVVPPDARPLMESRADARLEYRHLESRSAPYDVPFAIRDRMATWNFQQAELLIAEANEVLDRLHAVGERADRLGLELPASLEEAYEDARFSFDDLSVELGEARRALTAIENADRDEAGIDAARRRFEQGLFGAVIGEDGRLASASTSSGQVSATTIALVVGSGLLFLLLAIVVLGGGGQRPARW